MILTCRTITENCSPFWGKCRRPFTRPSLPRVSVHSYIFHADQSEYEPCSVKVTDFNVIQQELLKSEIIPRCYRIAPTYPSQQLEIINEIKTTPSIPKSLNAALQRLMELTPPELTMNGNVLSAERVFDNDCRLVFRFRLDGDTYRLLEASVHTDKRSRDIARELRNYRHFDHAYLVACGIADAFRKGGRNVL